jgi:hypothetical protein
VHQDIQLAVLFLEGGEEPIDLGVLRYVALIRFGAGQLLDHVLGFELQPLILVGDQQPCAGLVQLLGDAPRNTAFVGYAEDNGRAAFQIDHANQFLPVIAEHIC